ncbi:hypothetical protein, partial [Pseudomonas syringae]|uniref:hypothetical protein n=1 Tax=Pseudomonas syringae TaxID=317 RepID=UPI001E3BE544
MLDRCSCPGGEIAHWVQLIIQSSCHVTKKSFKSTGYARSRSGLIPLRCKKAFGLRKKLRTAAQLL